MGLDSAPPMTANIYNVMLPRLGVLVRAQTASLVIVGVGDGGGAEVSPPPETMSAFFVATLSSNSRSIELISVNLKQAIMSTP